MTCSALSLLMPLREFTNLAHPFIDTWAFIGTQPEALLSDCLELEGSIGHVGLSNFGSKLFGLCPPDRFVYADHLKNRTEGLFGQRRGRVFHLAKDVARFNVPIPMQFWTKRYDNGVLGRRLISS